MRILIALTYYRPHYSGLTIYVERLARALTERGHQVTILTSRYHPSLAAYETIDGVEIYRLQVALRLSKGVIMPSLPAKAWQLVKKADVINLHTPQLDAALIGVMGKILGKQVVMTYHCDLRLPQGLVHQIANQASHMANHISALAADIIVTNTQDYAENSPFLKHYLSKVQIISPPVELKEVTDQDILEFRQKAKILDNQPVIGMASRLATEKGVEYLLDAMPNILKSYPEARVIFVGQYLGVMGEESYAAKLAPAIQTLNDQWTFLGLLPPREFAAFLAAVDVTVLPSINSTESYGMVQIESMMSKTPVVATDIPGVRQPVRKSGMGIIVPPKDSTALGKAIVSIFQQPGQYQKDIRVLLEQHSPAFVAGQYEELFKRNL
jgi:glycosyltransferase involved in cell wall biosynthesis